MTSGRHSYTVPENVKRIYLYTSVRSIIGIAFTAWLWQPPAPGHILPAVILVMLMIASVELSVKIKDRTRVTLGMGPLMAAVLLFPPAFAALVAALGFAPGILTRPVYTWAHRWKMTFSVAGYTALVACLGGMTYGHLNGITGTPLLDNRFLLIVILVYLVLNFSQALLLLPSIVLRGAAWRDYLNVEFPLITLVNLFGVPVALGLVYLNNTVSPWAMLFMGIPLAGAMYLTYSLSEARDDLKQRVKELAILHEVSGEITRLLKLEQLSEMLHIESRKIIASPGFRVALALDRPDEQLIILDVVEGTRKQGFEPVGNSFEAHVMATGEPLRIDQWPEQAESLNLSCREEPWVRSYLGVPMRFENRCLGVIGVRSNRTFAYSEHHLEIILHFANNTAVAIENSRLFKEVQDSFIGTIEALIKVIEAKDPYTRNHSLRVAAMSSNLAVELGLDSEEIEKIRLAALLHDIGKIGLPEAILHKTGELDKVEQVLMQQHPERGADLIRGIKRLGNVLPVILRHHERMDGGGYPAGITGAEIPVGARIIAVADSFDAIISDRPYRKRMPVAEAIREIRRCRGTQFDPDVVDAFERIYARNQIDGLYDTDKMDDIHSKS